MAGLALWLLDGPGRPRVIPVDLMVRATLGVLEPTADGSGRAWRRASSHEDVPTGSADE